MVNTTGFAITANVTDSGEDMTRLTDDGMKHCRQCGTDKPTSMFSIRSNTKSGLQSECKQCMSARYHADRDAIRKRQKLNWNGYSIANADKLIEKSRDYRNRTKAKQSEYRNEYRKRFAPKIQAKNMVQLLLAKGGLTKMPCEICSAPVTDAHHDDYAKPLEVRWLCRRHHAIWHAEHGQAKNGEAA